MTSVSYENAATAALSSSAPRILQQMLALDDFEDAARRGIPRPIFGYINGGAETNASLRDNRGVWDELQFIPKTLVDTGDRNLKTTLMGKQYDLPFGIPPMGGTAMACADGDVALARAAAAVDLFHDDRGFGEAQARTAEFLGNQRRQPAGVGQCLDKGFGIAAHVVDLLPVGAVELVAHGAHAVAQVGMVGGLGNGQHRSRFTKFRKVVNYKPRTRAAGRHFARTDALECLLH